MMLSVSSEGSTTPELQCCKVDLLFCCVGCAVLKSLPEAHFCRSVECLHHSNVFHCTCFNVSGVFALRPCLHQVQLVFSLSWFTLWSHTLASSVSTHLNIALSHFVPTITMRTCCGQYFTVKQISLCSCKVGLWQLPMLLYQCCNWVNVSISVVSKHNCPLLRQQIEAVTTVEVTM